MVYGTGGKGALRTRAGRRRGVRAVLLTLAELAALAAAGGWLVYRALRRRSRPA